MDRRTSLYCPELESDACGIGLVADIKNRRSHQIVADALAMLGNMEHRGATGYEENSGDGAGILTHIPHELVCAAFQHHALPEIGEYGLGMMFLPSDRNIATLCKDTAVSVAESLDYEVVGFRPVQKDNSLLGNSARSTEPVIEQVVVVPQFAIGSEAEFDQKLFILRNAISATIRRGFPRVTGDFYFASFSCRTVVYKGQLTARQLPYYFHDLTNPEFCSAIALVHSRFSTNTTPDWTRAQPFRCIAHNGEINTITGNINWWRAREKGFTSGAFTKQQLETILPLCVHGQSDSQNFDRVLEFLTLNGRELPQVLMMMIPEAWQGDPNFDESKRAFYEYHSMMMEPWDGPAAICFTDGTLVGATLDRNGLRPARYAITKDCRLILGSESGCINLPASMIERKGRLEPGKILVADLAEQRIIDDHELKEVLSRRRPYRQWVDACVSQDDTLEHQELSSGALQLITRQRIHGFSKEDLTSIMSVMSRDAKEPIGSMGADIPLAVLSDQPQHIASYFRQLFAQVTNPPIDPIREAAFMSLKCHIGGMLDIISGNMNASEFITLESPVLDEKDLACVLGTNRTYFVDASFDPDQSSLAERIKILAEEVQNGIRHGRTQYLVIHHGKVDTKRVPIPSMLLCGAIHHALISTGLRDTVSIVAAVDDIWETHHYATLIGFGTDAVYPALAYAVCQNFGEDPQLIANYVNAVKKGLLKILSKQGISTISSFKAAQTFEALGIDAEVVDTCFKGVISRISGMTFEMLEKEAGQKHARAFDVASDHLEHLGIYQWRNDGESHIFSPAAIHLLQHSTRTGDYSVYRKFADLLDKREAKLSTLRSLLDFHNVEPIDLSEVEPIHEILKRFATGAMSFGSLSHEAHATLAIAMNRIGGKSNSGEGGEDPARYHPKPNGDSERSAIKQVASGRFGVTIEYLNQADELQIKMAQGAKPGEGGHLPGHKVNDWIARVRHSTPGVGLISPPPHHDIYSIEDLAQLIFDLKNANRDARISVKLVSKAGIGIIASGVAKGHAEHILVSGGDGGTGASPLSSIRYAGLPWELGLVETHQTLVKNKLRDRVTLQCDGQIRTGRDMAIATLLGAEEWGVATSALVVEGCVLMRKCHLNTCPVGVATQNEQLRKKFAGKVEHLVNYFHFLARDLREIMASLGIRTVHEMVGRSDLLKARPDRSHWKSQGVDLSRLLYRYPTDPEVSNYRTRAQNHGLDLVLDREIIAQCKSAIRSGTSVRYSGIIKNTDRAVGTMLSSEIARRYGAFGLPDSTIRLDLRGSAGQSFAAFGAKGVDFFLKGDANDYLGKGLSGAQVAVIPDEEATFDASQNTIIGNVALYGATSGYLYVHGIAGERFAVRNSGASAVVEGVGAHGCQYMTGGNVVVLGPVGRNFGAGMSGGLAFIYDPTKKMVRNINLDMVDLEAPTNDDYEMVHQLISYHLKATSSPVALNILLKWETNKYLFYKLYPKDLKRAHGMRRLSGTAILKKIRV